MIYSLSIGPRTLLNDCNHSATAIFWKEALSELSHWSSGSHQMILTVTCIVTNCARILHECEGRPPSGLSARVRASPPLAPARSVSGGAGGTSWPTSLNQPVKNVTHYTH